jgi:hypothetical protein
MPLNPLVFQKAHFLEVILQLRVEECAEDYFQLPFQLSMKWPFLRPLELFLVRFFPWFSMSNIAVIRRTSLLVADEMRQ